MKQLSSANTILYSKILPYVLVIFILGLLSEIVFMNATINEVGPPILAILMLIFAWYLYFRKLKVVYIEDNFFIVDNEKILFSNVISIKSVDLLMPHYVVKYRKGEEIKKFKFSVKSFLFFESSEIKRLKNRIYNKL